MRSILADYILLGKMLKRGLKATINRNKQSSPLEGEDAFQYEQKPASVRKAGEG